MATCVIEEFSPTGMMSFGTVVPVASQPRLRKQTITFTTATESTAFGERTETIRIQANSKMHYAFGDSPTATTDDPWLEAGEHEYFAVNIGQKVSVIVGS